MSSAKDIKVKICRISFDNCWLWRFSDQPSDHWSDGWSDQWSDQNPHMLIEEFRVSLLARHLSPNTISPYIRELGRLASFQAKRGILPSEIAIQHLTRYIARDDSANATNQRRLVILKQFFRWAGLPVSRELDSMRAPKVVRPVPDFLSEAEERQLRQTLKSRTDKRHQVRDRALICLMLDTGVRVSEAVGLDVSAVDLDSKRIHLVTKGGKKRSKFISADVRGQFSTLFAQLPSKISQDLPVFQSGKGGRLTDRQVRRILSSWAELSGITKPVHPHMLRHTFATSLLGKTGNLRLVQKALDHENPQTTAIYAHVVDEELQGAVEGRSAT